MKMKTGLQDVPRVSATLKGVLRTDKHAERKAVVLAVHERLLCDMVSQGAVHTSYV